MTQQQIVTALQGLRPGAEWSLSSDVYADINWLDTKQTIPTEAEIAAFVVPPLHLLRDYDMGPTIAQLLES